MSKRAKGKVQPIRILASVPVGMCKDALALARLPTARELSTWTGDNPDLFPEKWTIEQAQFCLDNLGHVLNAESDR
jgi:hypothetical protein